MVMVLWKFVSGKEKTMTMTKISSKRTCYTYGHGPLINLLQSCQSELVWRGEPPWFWKKNAPRISTEIFKWRPTNSESRSESCSENGLFAPEDFRLSKIGAEVQRKPLGSLCWLSWFSDSRSRQCPSSELHPEASDCPQNYHLLHGPFEHILGSAAPWASSPHHPCENGTHSTSFCSTRGHSTHWVPQLRSSFCFVWRCGCSCPSNSQAHDFAHIENSFNLSYQFFAACRTGKSPRKVLNTLVRGGTNRVFGKPCSTKTAKTANMTKIVGVTQAKAWFRKSRVCSCVRSHKNYLDSLQWGRFRCVVECAEIPF